MKKTLSKIPVTVIVPARNEELNLPLCLEKLNRFDQIIVVDSNSTDKTVEIAKNYNTEIYQFIWNGKFPKKRNWALRNLKINNDWVFFLDADEFLTEAFIDELTEKIKNTNYNGFKIKYSNHFMNKVLKHGYPLIKLSLFKVGKGEYEKIEENNWSNLDMEVHEHPIIEGTVGKLKTKIIHKDFKSIEHYIAKHNAYSSWEANRFFIMKMKGRNNLTISQRIKYLLLKIGLLPLCFFLGSYFLMLGFLDGKQGYIVARFKANYFFQIQVKLKELKNKYEATTKK